MPEAAVAVEPKRAAMVVTNANASEVYDAHMSANQPKAEPAPAPEAKPEGDAPAAAANPEGEAKPDAKVETPVEDEAEHKKNPRLQKRFSELTEARKKAEALAEQTAETLKSEREAREAAERRAQELTAKYEPPKTDEIGPEPQLSQFTDVNEYAQALKDWSGEKALHDQRTAQEQEQAQRAERERAETWQKRQEAAKKDIPDYEAVLNASPVRVTNVLRDAIVESEVGPQLLHHFAKNPDVAERLNKLSPVSALRELGKLEATLGGEHKPTPAAAVKPDTPVAEISAAPAPAKPLRPSGGGGDGNAVPRNADGKFVGTYEQWSALRKAGKIK